MNLHNVTIAELEPLAINGMYSCRGFVVCINNCGRVSLVLGVAK